MTQYRIASERLTVGAMGQTVSDEDLAGLNIEALVAGGHLEKITTASKTKTNDNTEEK